MKVALLAQPDINIVDGSTIWVLNTLRMLAGLKGCDPIYLSQTPITDRTLADLIPPQVRVVDIDAFRELTDAPWANLNPAGVVEALARWEHCDGPLDRLIVRGDPYLERLSQAEAFAGRLTGYAADVLPRLGVPVSPWLASAKLSRMDIVVQSETAARVLASLCDYPAHLIHVVPPVVPPLGHVPDAKLRNQLVYAGKVDPVYGLDWLFDYARLDHAGLTILAGKEARRAHEPAFYTRFDRLKASPPVGVTLRSGLSHDRALAAMALSEFGYCLRDAAYDDCLEVSTKVVEYCTLGVIPIVNNTQVNRDVFGRDYPFLITPEGERTGAHVLDRIMTATDGDRECAHAAMAEINRRHDARHATDVLHRALRLPQSEARLTIATHDRKFIRQWAETPHLHRATNVVWEDWTGAAGHASAERSAKPTQTILCEWCCENAIWHSHNKQPGTRLVIRLHRFEAFTDQPARVHWPSVDRLIVTSDHFRDRMIAEVGVPPDIIRVVPQYIDWQALQRPKHAAADRTVGMVGINPFGQKRLDRALDLIADLRARDPRFRLIVRSEMPWRLGWVWTDAPDMHAAYRAAFTRMREDPMLAGAVRFDPPGPDMAEWYRNVGVILSTSDTEGCHTAVMEGMASGALPVVHDWPGARPLFKGHVYSNMANAVTDICCFADASDVAARRAAISQTARDWDIWHFGEAVYAA